jgi:voltage-gated potassium channel
MPRDSQLPNATTGKRWFEFFSQGVVFYSIIVLYMETEARLTGGTSQQFWVWNERALLVFFSLEYVVRWGTSKRPMHYPFSLLGFIDLLAIIPSLAGIAPSLRSLKLLRALRMLTLLKLYRYNRALQNVMHGFRRVKEELAIVGFVAVILMMVSSLAVFEFEHDAQPERFTHVWDAIWWSFVTLSTVGYGDVVPITVGGRLIGMLTMLVGIGIFGTFISLVGSSFLTTMREQDAAHAGHVAGEPEEEQAAWTEPNVQPHATPGDLPG